MAGNMNRVTLIGHLGADPDIRSSASGRSYANFTMATTESWKDKQSGEKQERTEWHRVLVWSEGLVGLCEKYLRKGSKAMIEGQLQTRKWQDQSGADRYAAEIVLNGFSSQIILLDNRGSGNRPPEPDAPDYGAGNGAQGGNGVGYGDGAGDVPNLDQDDIYRGAGCDL